MVADILQALDSGQLHCAVLNAHDQEPLAQESPLWTHPGVVVSLRCAAKPSRRDRAQFVANLITRFEQGGDLPNLYDGRRGYSKRVGRKACARQGFCFNKLGENGRYQQAVMLDALSHAVLMLKIKQWLSVESAHIIG